MPIRSAEYMEDMRERILTAMSDCLEKKGLANTSLTDVCKEAKISRGALYVHFESKSELLCGIVDRATSRMEARCRFSDAGTLRRFVVSETRLLLSSSAALLYTEMELIAAVRADPAMRDAIQRNTNARSDAFLAGMQGVRDRGELREGLSVEAAAELAICFFDGLLTRPFGTLRKQDVYLEAADALLVSLLKPDILQDLTVKDAAA